MYRKDNAIATLEELIKKEKNPNRIALFTDCINIIKFYNYKIIAPKLYNAFIEKGFTYNSKYLSNETKRKKYPFKSYSICIIDNHLYIGLSQTHKYVYNWLEFDLNTLNG